MDNTYNAENIFNVNLHIVLDELRGLSETQAFCSCGICLDDICVIALSQLPPSYTTNLLDREEIINLIDREKVRNLLLEAIQKVSTNPHH